MATIIETKLQLRRGTEAEWSVVAESFVPLEGEPCVTTDGKHRGQLKIGDGTTAWGALKYIGATVDNNIFLVANDSAESDLDKIQEMVGATPLNKGDMAIVKKLITGDKYEYKAYIYVTQWEAMDGNYSAENVFFKTDMVITANIGVQTIGASGSKTIATTGKNVKQVFDMIVAQEKNPSVTQPTATINSNNIGTKEVGTNIQVAYSFATNPGSYQYGPNTGVTFSDYSATFNGETLNTSSGTFKQIQVTDDTNLTITGSVAHSGGAVPKTNLGNEYLAGQIQSKTLKPSKGVLKGFRGWFYGYKNGTNAIANPNVITSAEIRALSSPVTSIPAQISTNLMKQMFFAIPKGVKNSVTVSDATNGAPQTVTKITDVMVTGANEYSAIPYDVWFVNNAAAASGAAKFNITIK